MGEPAASDDSGEPDRKKRNMQSPAAGSTPRVIYLDHHATTPVHAEVWRDMGVFSSELFYNPSGMYSGSIAVQQHLKAAADTVKSFLSAPRHEVVFTSGATEANNMENKCFNV